jgi:hypothetical protein
VAQYAVLPDTRAWAAAQKHMDAGSRRYQEAVEVEACSLIEANRERALARGLQLQRQPAPPPQFPAAALQAQLRPVVYRQPIKLPQAEAVVVSCGGREQLLLRVEPRAGGRSPPVLSRQEQVRWGCALPARLLTRQVCPII